MMTKQLKLSAFVFALFFLFQGMLFGQTSFFWEQPEVFSGPRGSFPVSASTGDLGILVWQETDRRAVSGANGSGDGAISIALAVKKPGASWENKGIIGGPYLYSGTEPSIISAVIDKQNRILIAAAASAAETEILISGDEGQSFEKYRIDSGTESSVAPRIAVRSDGGYLLFVTRGSDSSLSLYYALSDNGRVWSAFRPFVTDNAMQLNFLPSHASYGGREYVIFQSFTGSSETIPTFQLFLKMSSDNGRTWGPSQRFTSFRDAYMYTSATADNFDNQRPQLTVQNDSLFLVWERRYRTGSPQVYAARIRADGSLIGAPERINTNDAYCNNPVAFTYGGDTKVIWFDNRRGGNRIYLAQREGLNWINTDLSGSVGGDASFGRSVVDSDGLFIFWQTTTAQGSARIYSLLPDTSVNPVRITAGNFTPGRRTRGERARFSWNVPVDSSGISGFAYAWSKDEDVVPNKNIMVYNTRDSAATSAETVADDDGSWYFTIIAQDYAGNWSPPSRIEYIRDTIPPPAAAIIQPDLDENGFLLSNTFTLNWNVPPASDIAGYTWDLQYLGSSAQFSSMDNGIFQAAASELYPGSRAAAPRVQGTGTSVSYTNQDDGVWLFTVRAIDEVGNVGPHSSIYFRTDKYVPHTYITWVDASQDEQGILDLRIMGRGFADGGSVIRVFLDKDGQEPYDREFYLRNDDYRIASDREINGLRIEDIEEGNYRVGVEHPVRGLYITGPMVAINETGTVKFGDYGSIWQPSWLLRHARRFIFDTAWFVVIAILVLCGLGILVVIRGIGNVVAESAVIRLDAAALITGDFMPSEKKKRLARIKRRGIGLRFKMASFTVALVMLVVVMVSAPLYVMMTRTQRDTLLQGLWDRSTVLLEGLATNTRAYLPMGNILELGFLPAQMSAIPEARYVTITGYNPDTTIFDDAVWATNDTDILAKVDTVEFQPGVSRITDEITPRLQGIADELNDQARSAVGDLSATIASFNQEARSIATNLDAASQQRLEDIQVTTRSLEAQLTERLSEIGRQIRSEPEFSTDNFTADKSRVYVFFKPVMYRQGTEDTYFRGLIRLEVSIDSILEDIAEGQQDLLRIIIVVALAAIAIGAVGALVLSTLIIHPIRRLVSHVEVIRDTEDKADLEGVDIHIKTHDEIAVLGNTINDMTHGLVKAAAAASDLSIGKEIQKKFIPLDLDKEGNKLSTGYKKSENAHFFGYYEGAKGVSGDYFDYQDLDGRYYAVIKCDVAGKGIPAALIMIQVATMFLNYFKQWKPTEKGMHIEDVVYQINEFIETLAFKGRFAAFTLCLFDSQTGKVRFCNAGDNIIHLFDASEGCMKTLTLPETPATGVLPNFMVESKGGYSVQTMTLDHGDILLLYTDGIEEAKRKFRNSAFEDIICTEGGAPNDTPHENHVVGQGDEEMGPDRVLAIINAVMNKGTYTLHKWHNPEGDATDLNFDFTSCDGKVEEVIMAMVSVEKMFRCYKDPKATADNRVLVDKKIDDFLKEHFLQYRSYCSFTRENPGNDAYMYYTNVKEDDQYDDLTILGIKRK
ncbi:SpoIIE family protein phosphatase [Leadbettera azotonutricia]|uniref:Hamp domain protein n=1 Tax=Leadbettera azotonutricia (strain ATCC BAA-888 / DSM 13862 / ZAS-9) TaxID=545695 RepID=F5Y9J4_LEAAZ|nr:SpoIIE family protein phosphatase [Leadbettera azotonutricia]AEF80705.1 hamp domain protein [Leadbettera azotonutricia ZAS-9]